MPIALNIVSMLLVSQQGSLHRVADENAIDRLVEQVFTGQLDSETLKKKRQFKGNLKQLCGFIQHGHNSKSLVNGYQIFDRMRWICMDGAKELVPILGTPEEAFKTVLNRTDVNFSLDDLKQLLPTKSGNQKKKQVGKHPYIWRLALQPPITAFQNIPDGGRLTDFYVSAEVFLAVNPAAAVIPAAERARQARVSVPIEHCVCSMIVKDRRGVCSLVWSFCTHRLAQVAPLLESSATQAAVRCMCLQPHASCAF